MVQRFYFPLTVNACERDWDEDWDNPIEGDGKTAIRYRGDIENAFDKCNAGAANMAEYFSRSKSAKEKIERIDWRFEAVDGCLYGRVDVVLTEPLNDVETNSVKNWICGQNSDGLGECFEQREIKTNDGNLICVSFWNPSDDYRIMTEEEFRNR